MPGSARQIIEAHVYGERVSADAIRRLTRAEATAVVVGAIGAQLLTVGGLVAAVVLLVLGYPAAAIAGVIPAILGASAQIVSASRRRSPE
ncbi:hypothetical protein [Agromyces larvae]|uniref:ABC transporter ATP-binding protein n=1 Tax=Agromyces larvae TaxID=2929802 RepID=A0ABY4C2N6_9MICO|nr:hypothetical protein [Agromyces larvae]UOE45459.1 hypothetical protein MTO99_06800 [Agromyces larvae]